MSSRSRWLPPRPVPGRCSLPSSARPDCSGAPALLPGLVSAPGGPPAPRQVTCVGDNLSQGGPGGPRAADWSARGWRGSGRGWEADQLFPELHNNKRTRTGRRTPGQRPQRRSPARRSYLSARPPRRAALLGSRKCGRPGREAAVGCPLLAFLPGPLPTVQCAATPRTCE